MSQATMANVLTPSGRTTNVAQSSINPKLLHLVQRAVQQHANNSNNNTSKKPPSVDYVTHLIRAQNVEYQRKNMERLKKQVTAALAVVVSNSNNYKNNNNGLAAESPESRKRSRAGKPPKQQLQESSNIRNGEEPASNLNSSETSQQQQQPVEEDVAISSGEEDLRQHEVLREKTVGNGALNASLRLGYEKLQRQRDAAAKAAQEAAVDGSGTSGPAEETKQNDSNFNNSNTAQSSSSRKRKLSERKKSKSAPSSTSTRRASTAGLGGHDLDDDNDTSSLLRPVPRPKERYSDLGGMTAILQQIRELVEYPLVRPELYTHLGISPPRGILLRGPPGTGKTHLANAIAGHLGVNYFRVSAPELVSGMSGESESRIRDLFRTAADMAPSIIFLDELDAIAPKRSEAGSARGMEKRMVAQLLTSMDLLDPMYTRNQAPVMVLGATNRPDALDIALRRAGRFDKEIVLGVPDEDARQHILRAMTKDMRLSGDFDYKVLARKTPGFVGADVRSLTKEAAVVAINRIFRDVLLNDNYHENANINKSQTTTNTMESTADVGAESIAATDGETLLGSRVDKPFDLDVKPLTPEQLDPLYVTMDDFLNAVRLVQPSGQREGFAVVPDVTWDDIGAMHEIREEVTLSVLEPIRNPEKFKALGLSLPAGVLLYGPPGCGKTLIAKAIANESGANFISVKGPELLDKYVGASEQAVRLVFERARYSSPCIVFFDELDSLCPKRGSDGGSSSGVSERVVNQLLTEMDGLETRRSVFVIAATNRPELIDPAMMRPGRLDKLLYVQLPSTEDRVAILKALATNVKFGDGVDLESIGRSSRTDGYSGADCAALLREAGLAVLKEDLAASALGQGKSDADLCILPQHFQIAFNHVMPSVSRKDQARYDRMRDRMARARTRGGVSDDAGTEGQPIGEHGAAVDGTS